MGPSVQDEISTCEPFSGVSRNVSRGEVRRKAWPVQSTVDEIRLRVWAC